VLSSFAEANHLSRGRFIEAALTQPPFEEGASMRKHNHSIPPVFKQDSRLINSAVRSRKCNRPNALKHGFYSEAPLIPGEDPREYQERLAELMDEWKPSGPTLRDGVFELAELRFKQRRLRRSTQTKLSLTAFDPRNPAFDQAWGLTAFLHFLISEPETCFEQHASRYLLPDKINYLKQKFPRPNYQSTSEWAKAVINEIFLVLIPGIQGDKTLDAPELADDLRDEYREASRQWRAQCQVAVTMTHASELLDYEFKQGELLEARIQRKIKFLVELKTMEQMLGRT